MESFIDSCIYKLKLKKFQVAKVPKIWKPHHIQHCHGDEENKEDWKTCIKEYERNQVTPTNIKARLKIFENNNKNLKTKNGISKHKGMKNLFLLLDEENNHIDENNHLNSKYTQGIYLIIYNR